MNLEESQSEFITGCHEKCPVGIMPDGWILYLAEVSDSDNPHPGIDLSGETRGRMIRIQWKFGDDGGCYPPPPLNRSFIQRVASLTRNTPDCHIWIGGNESNIKTEGLHTPEYAAQNYNAIRGAIHDQSGHEDDQVLLPPVGPWNVEIGYGWIEYFERMIDNCSEIDAFALHTYSRGPDPTSIISEDKMDAPYEIYYNGFRTYRDWLAAIPERYRERPVYITETNQNDAWLDAPNEWCQVAYDEIDVWNNLPSEQTIRALILYRWPAYDKYNIEGKQYVIADFQAAQEHGYTWKDEEEPPMVDWTATYTNPCDDYQPQGSPQMPVLAGWIVDWNRNLPRPEMAFKYEPQPEVYPLDPPRSGVGFHVNTAFDWWLRTERPIAIAAGVRTKLSVALMVVAHGIEDDDDKLGDCGMIVGFSGPDVTDVTSLDILWSEWRTVRDGPGGNLEEYTWITAETPEVIPGVGLCTLWIRCVANVAADISAGHYDLIQVLQITDGPVEPPIEPPTGTYTVVVYDPAGNEVVRCPFEATADVNPAICSLAQSIVTLACPD